jgi:hypothetical protein
VHTVVIKGDDGTRFSCPEATSDQLKPYDIKAGRIKLTLLSVRRSEHAIERRYPRHVAAHAAVVATTHFTVATTDSSTPSTLRSTSTPRSSSATASPTQRKNGRRPVNEPTGPSSPSAHWTGENMAFKFMVISRDGEIFESTVRTGTSATQ